MVWHEEKGNGEAETEVDEDKEHGSLPLILNSFMGPS